jgi:hypothetical protein
MTVHPLGDYPRAAGLAIVDGEINLDHRTEQRAMNMTRTRATVAAVVASVGLATAAVPTVSQAMPPQGPGGGGCRYMGYEFENGTSISYDGFILACQGGQVHSIGYV